MLSFYTPWKQKIKFSNVFKRKILAFKIGVSKNENQSLIWEKFSPKYSNSNVYTGDGTKYLIGSFFLTSEKKNCTCGKSQ